MITLIMFTNGTIQSKTNILQKFTKSTLLIYMYVYVYAKRTKYRAHCRAISLLFPDVTFNALMRNHPQ